MKKSNQRILFYFLLILTLVIIGGLLWFGYQSYASYHRDSASTRKLKVVNEADALVRSVGKERLKSVHFLVGGDKAAMAEMKKARSEVDRRLRNVKADLSFLSNPLAAQLLVKGVVSELKTVRSRIDAMSGEHRDLLVDGYQKGVFDQIVKLYGMIADAVGDAKMAEGFKYGSALMELYSNAELERSFLDYFLTKGQRMEGKDLLVWDGTISKDALPPLSTIKESLFRMKVAKRLMPVDYPTVINPSREKILYGVNDGQYPIGSKEWLKVADGRMQRLLQAISLIE